MANHRPLCSTVWLLFVVFPSLAVFFYRTFCIHQHKLYLDVLMNIYSASYERFSMVMKRHAVQKVRHTTHKFKKSKAYRTAILLA